jgi:integrase
MGKLTDKALRALKPQDRIYNVADGAGLSVEVWPNGGMYWRFRYRFAGKAKRLSLGVYPEVSLKEARDTLAAARATLRAGVDPSQDRRQAKAALLTVADREFGKVAGEWLAHQKAGWAAETYRKAAYIVDQYLADHLKGTDIATLGTPEARRAIGAIAARAPALAQKARGHLGSIVEFAIHRGLREEGRTLSLKGAVPKHGKGHIAAATNPDDVRTLLGAIDGYDSPVTRAALVVAMLTALRPGVVAGARWDEIDLEAAEWLVPADRMKTRHAHLIPLPRQAVDELRGMLKFTAGTDYVFPPLARQKSAHLHRDALSAALRRMGLQGVHATHGFRAMFRTVARERLGVAADVLEAQLAHAKRGDVQKAYDRTQFLEERTVAMQRWADYLDTLRRKSR